jgi:hypothetical protein
VDSNVLFAKLDAHSVLTHVATQVERSLPNLEAKAQMLEAQCSALKIEDEDKVCLNYVFIYLTGVLRFIQCM